MYYTTSNNTFSGGLFIVIGLVLLIWGAGELLLRLAALICGLLFIHYGLRLCGVSWWHYTLRWRI